jgi:hypothetical protein
MPQRGHNANCSRAIFGFLSPIVDSALRRFNIAVITDESKNGHLGGQAALNWLPHCGSGRRRVHTSTGTASGP